MGSPDEVDEVTEAAEAPRATVEEVQPANEGVHVNHDIAERMDGAFLSIVLSAALPCGLVIGVTAILLGVIYGKQVGRYQGWPVLYVAQQSSSTTGLWQTLNGWKKSGGEAAVFVNFNPSSLTAIAALTGKVIPYLSSSIMALVAFFVARRIILVSQQGQSHELPTSQQMSLLIQLLGGNSYGPLKDTVHYHIKQKKRWVSPIPHAFSALAAVTALGIIIPAVDTWFSTTVTPVKVAKVEKVTNSSHADYGRWFASSNDCYYDWVWSGPHKNHTWNWPCNMNYEYWDKDINDTAKYSYTTLYENEAALAVAGRSKTNVARQYVPEHDPSHEYTYLADTRADDTRDFRARTIAIKTQCTPMISHCFPPNISNPNVATADNYGNIGSDYTFHCSAGFTGQLTSNGASLATGLRTSSSVAAGIGFAPDARLSRMIGNNVSEVEFAAYTNPLYFGAWTVGYRVQPANDYNDSDEWDEDLGTYVDANYFYAWMLNCSADVYYGYYDWVNGSVADFNVSLAPVGMSGVTSWPFVSGLPIAQLCLDMAAIQVSSSNDSTTLANVWAANFSACAVDLLAGTLDAVPTVLEQTRDNAFGATRVPVVPLFALLGLKFLYCLAVFGLAVAAYHLTNPAETQSVKERLTAKGLAATYFCDSPSHQQIAVKNVEQLFHAGGAGAGAGAGGGAAGDVEAGAPAPPEPKVAMVQTDMGGWQFVKLAAAKVYDTVSPIVEKQLMGDATAGQFGTDGTDAANWISLVRK